MTRHPPVVREDADLAEILDMVISTRLNRAVVLDDSGHPVGVVSDTDVLQHLEPHRRPGLLDRLMGRSRAAPAGVAPVTARDIMRRPPIVASPDAPITSVARRMVEACRKVLSVVGPDGPLLGIVDRAHLLAAARDAGSA